MPIQYAISEDLNMVLYVCTGQFTGREFFETSDLVLQDPRRKHGMISIVDMLNAEEIVDFNDMRYGIKWAEELKAKGLEIETMAVLSTRKGISLLVTAVNLISIDVALKFRAFYTLEDALIWLGMPDASEQVRKLWDEARS